MSVPFAQIGSNVVDYKYSLHGVPVGSDEYLRILSEVCAELCSFMYLDV